MTTIIGVVVFALLAFAVWLMHTDDRSYREHEEWVRAVRLANEPHPEF